jgi:hypothetical protein
VQPDPRRKARVRLEERSDEGSSGWPGSSWRPGQQNQEPKAKTERAKAEGQVAVSKLTFVLCFFVFGFWLLVLLAWPPTRPWLSTSPSHVTANAPKIIESHPPPFRGEYKVVAEAVHNEAASSEASGELAPPEAEAPPSAYMPRSATEATAGSGGSCQSATPLRLASGTPFETSSRQRWSPWVRRIPSISNSSGLGPSFTLHACSASGRLAGSARYVLSVLAERHRWVPAHGCSCVVLEGVYGNDNEAEERPQTIRAMRFLAKI